MAPTARFEEHAQTLRLGRHLRSWRWTKYHYFPIGLFTGAMTAGNVTSWLSQLRAAGQVLTREDLAAQLLAIGFALLATVLMVGFAAATGYFLWGALSGTGRALHLYQYGLIVSRPLGIQSLQFQSLASVHVQRSSTVLIPFDGPKLVVDKREAVPEVVAAARGGGVPSA